jgi:hypothetical protein
MKFSTSGASPKVIEIDFECFHNGEYQDDGYELYTIKNDSGDLLYIGISQRGICERWFGFGGHILWSGNYAAGNSAIGQRIVDHLPKSLNWKISLWSFDDCVSFCKNDFHIPAIPTIQLLESYMISKLSPIMNEVCNLKPGKDTTSKSQKELEREKILDEVYRKVFEKK